MARFENKFFKVLKEQDDEREAFEATLDDETEAGEFDVDVEVDETVVDEDPNVKAAMAVEERNAAMRSTLKGWIDEIDGFLHYLNGEDLDSIQTLLANAEPDTIFDRMKQSEQRKIARVATELAALNESFKGYIAQTNNAQFKYV
mgnify:FL=1|jgi:uncharacterized damage-inducible protein DinB|tara:strand:- start:711 stop:1145 length:435 start_codon:yes stop_codon:yes gene_type:complete